MLPFLRAGLCYGLGLFAAGFILGTLRVLLIAPIVGDAIAVLCEVPLMLFVSWSWAGWIDRRFRPQNRNSALAIGLFGFAVLLAGEFALGIALMGMTPAEWLASLSRPTGQIGLIAQLIAAAMPLLHARRLPRG
jgi:hypothetical protein